MAKDLVLWLAISSVMEERTTSLIVGDIFKIAYLAHIVLM